LGETVERAESREQRPKAEQSRSEQQTNRPENTQTTNREHDEAPKRRWPLVILGIVVVLTIIAGIVYWLMTRNLESTDDAYTEGNAIAFAPKVSGYVTQLNVDDNTIVHKNELLLKIDPRDYIAARDQARAALSLAQSQLSSAEVDLEITRTRAPATLLQAQAQLAQAQANQNQAQRDYNRQHAVDPRATTQANIDQATAQLKSNAAQVKSAEAQVQIASLVQQTIQAAEDTVTQRKAQVEQAQANLATAEINLSYTELRAPQDGRITRRNVDLGTFVQAGQQVFYIVTPQVWVTANFKETQLADMHPGQHVTMNVDAYPNLHLQGHVDSIQQGSGARFSAFPAENATGNFVKIVRRVPVKIIIDSGLDNDRGLPLGISVTPTVTVR
jgi:membrane fusion protein (multidrug efflux system)